MVSQQPKQSENDVAIVCGIRHDLLRTQNRLLIEQPFQEIKGVADRARDDEGVKSTKLVTGEIVIGDAPSRTTVLRIGTGMDRLHWGDKP